MNGRIGEIFEILPDTIQVANAALILILIPIFEYFIYPMLGKSLRISFNYSSVHYRIVFFFFKKMGQSRPIFVYFRSFLITISIIQIEKSVDGVLGIQTRSRRMIGADKTTELWRPPQYRIVSLLNKKLGKAVVVTQLVEQSLPKPELHGSNPIHSRRK